MSDFITLTCPSCGEKLQINSDINRFACASCGIEYLVKRTPSLVTLVPAMEALNSFPMLERRLNPAAVIRQLMEELDKLAIDLGSADFAISSLGRGTDYPFRGMVETPENYVEGASEIYKRLSKSFDRSTAGRIERFSIYLAWREAVYPKMEKAVSKYRKGVFGLLTGADSKSELEAKLMRCKEEIDRMRRYIDRISFVRKEIERHQKLLDS